MTVPRSTHEVRNQVPPLTGYDVADDATLLAAAGREGAGWAADELHVLGRLAGSAATGEQARLANEHPPVLRSHDRWGNRIDEVEFHPAWHALMGTAVGHGLHAAPWADQRPGAHVARAAKFYVWAQAEPGHGCPVSMTYAAIPALRHAPALAGRFEPILAAPSYDPGLRPPETKHGLLAGMAMTEKQGGSDVRANTTRAEPAPGAGPQAHVLTGHKWFCSAPMCDLFLTLAYAPDGLTCFLLPRVLPGGEHNGLRIERLKDKLGNRSNASAEIELDAALAWQVGEPGRGVATIIEMVSATRLDCVLGSAAGMRLATRRGGASRQPPPGVRQGSDRASADEHVSWPISCWNRRRRPCLRSGWPGLPTGPSAATRPSRRCCGRPFPRPSTGCANARPRTPPRRSNAWAGTGTWRNPGCPGCTGRRR